MFVLQPIVSLVLLGVWFLVSRLTKKASGLIAIIVLLPVGAGLLGAPVWELAAEPRCALGGLGAGQALGQHPAPDQTAGAVARQESVTPCTSSNRFPSAALTAPVAGAVRAARDEPRRRRPPLHRPPRGVLRRSCRRRLWGARDRGRVCTRATGPTDGRRRPPSGAATVGRGSPTPATRTAHSFSPRSTMRAGRGRVRTARRRCGLRHASPR